MPQHDKMNNNKTPWVVNMIKVMNKWRVAKGKPSIDCEPHKDKIIAAFEAWKEADKTKMTFKELKGEKKETTIIVTCEGAEPNQIVLRVRELPETENEHYHSESDATKATAEAGFAPKRLDAGEELLFVLEEYAGVEPSKEKTHKDMAELLANIHKVPTEWFDKYREKVTETYEVLKEVSPGNPVWWYATHPECLKGIEAEVLKGLVEDATEPISESGKKVVTCHGNFHKDNVLENAEKKLTAIDFEFACSGWAALDIAMHFNYTPYSVAQKKEFIDAYLKASGQEEENVEETGKLLYDVEMAGTRAGMSNSYLTTCDAKKNNKGYEGEVWAEILKYELKAREDAEIQKKIVANGVWLAAATDGDDAYKKTWEKWSKLYMGGSKGCCACNIM